MTHSTKTSVDHALTYVGALTLRYSGRLEEAEAAHDRIGVYIGSGEGEITGPRLHGRIPRWDLYEEVGESVCRSNLSGTVTTADGARIHFDSMGFFVRADPERPNLWRTTAAVHFTTGDPRYAWLDGALGVWEGTFDMDAYLHRYRVYARKMEV